ncbi:hypothetical protein SOASR014_38300 [Pectobacterium carotovorum subsp. carotovorum]|nr:hypothetical protein SOASR014_38300 [Pectobacterium carotovorum subsp. carotovorum]
MMSLCPSSGVGESTIQMPSSGRSFANAFMMVSLDDYTQTFAHADKSLDGEFDLLRRMGG